MKRPERDYRASQEIIRIRRILEKAQGYVCPICGESFPENEYKADRVDRPSLDHVLPMALGGMDQVGNYLATHVRCNVGKGKNLPTGCEIIWLMSVNAILGWGPQTW